MSFVYRMVLLGAITCLAAGICASVADGAVRHPRIIMAGNGGVCSLSTHKTFRMKLTGWKPVSTVQLKIYYGNGTDYPYQLRNGGKIKVDRHGDHTGPPWPCWPNKTYNVPDKKTYYIVFAFQLGSTPLAHATAVFKVVK